MRYFAEIAYNGTRYCGWQRQPNGVSVQEKVEAALSLLLGVGVVVTGCGRTDAGVHASQYFLHFDAATALPEGLMGRLNRMLPADIVVYRLWAVETDWHARFDALRRSYVYHIALRKDPFQAETSWHFPFFQRLDLERVQAAAKVLLSYGSFYPFCKSETDAKTMLCRLSRAEWVLDEGAYRYDFHISADRFLRGMVRLIVGMCLNVGMGKLSLDEVRVALEQQERLRLSWSVPPEGLWLNEVVYPFTAP
jgi:tRNA pseudouridine38-40 synthase